MADIKLLLHSYGGQDDDQEEDDYSKYYESSMLDQTNPDDLLTPLEKLHKYCTSENIFTRQMVARSIVETVQSISNEQECLSLLDIINKLSDDIEPSVRCELMEQLPPCCMMIMDMRLVPDAISSFILPVMVKYLTDPNNQVRKLSQNALLQLMDQDLIHRDEVESQICPVLLQLTEPDSGDDLRTEAVALMTKITPLIGGDVTEELFLKRFGDLCADPLFHVRKVCASNFGDMSSVLKQETTENNLLPLFGRLCEDGVWGVRKACAETFMAVSGTCSREVKYDKLSPLFVGLLCDKSRWVQMAAYQALGQFIATFADPRRTGFEVNEEGNLVKCALDTTLILERDETQVDPRTRGETSDMTASSSIEERLTNSLRNKEEGKSDPSNNFNSFEYWRTPLPNLDESNSLETNMMESNVKNSDLNLKSNVEIDSGLTKQESDSSSSSTKEVDNLNEENAPLDDTSITQEDEGSSVVKVVVESYHGNDDDDDSDNSDDSVKDKEDGRSVSPHSSGRHRDDQDFDLFNVNPASDDCHSDDEDHLHTSSNYTSSLVDEESLRSQKIVPPALLEHYISMTEPNKTQTIDGELPRHCAFTLPGVVLALGRDNWHLIKETYDVLSSDMQWKVRRTLAFSIHDLALILGQDICVADLVPIFNGFLKDLDEVRVGVLKHLYDFINILPVDLQKDYLHVFIEFQRTDNMRNWRFRQDLAHQLMSLVHLYDVGEVAEFICPVSLDLVCDKVAEVREYSFHLLCLLVQKLCEESNKTSIHKFATNIMFLATHHQHWVKRKACAQIYLRFLEGNWYNAASFTNDFLASLLTLCSDVVPNVRMIAAKALLAFIKTDHYQNLSEEDEPRKLVARTLEALQLDDDRDVRYFSGGKVQERVSQNSTFVTEHLHQAGVSMIQRGVHEYAISDDDDETEYDDDDMGFVEEVYIEEHPNNNEIIVEEYYVEEEPGEGNEDNQFYVEEIIEEIIETVGSTKDEKS